MNVKANAHLPHPCGVESVWPEGQPDRQLLWRVARAQPNLERVTARPPLINMVLCAIVFGLLRARTATAAVEDTPPLGSSPVSGVAFGSPRAKAHVNGDDLERTAAWGLDCEGERHGALASAVLRVVLQLAGNNVWGSQEFHDV